mgnify:CR=1 FL=1
MSEIIMLSDVRLSFPHLVEPQKNQTNDGKYRVSYSAEFIMPMDHKGFKDFQARVGELAQEKWKDHAQSVLNMIQQDRKLRCYGKGDEKINQKTFKVYDGYEGNVYITAGCSTIMESADGVAKRPQMIQQDGSAVDAMNTMAYQQTARKMYGGCRVNVAIKPWCQENKHGRGIRCDLVAIQFLRDDEPFGGGSEDVSEFFGAVKSEASPAAQDTGVMPPFLQ